MLPTSALAATAEAPAISYHSDEYSKLCDTAMALNYQDRTAYVRGFAGIVFC